MSFFWYFMSLLTIRRLTFMAALKLLLIRPAVAVTSCNTFSSNFFLFFSLPFSFVFGVHREGTCNHCELLAPPRYSTASTRSEAFTSTYKALLLLLCAALFIALMGGGVVEFGLNGRIIASARHYTSRHFSQYFILTLPLFGRFGRFMTTVAPKWLQSNR